MKEAEGGQSSLVLAFADDAARRRRRDGREGHTKHNKNGTGEFGKGSKRHTVLLLKDLIASSKA